VCVEGWFCAKGIGGVGGGVPTYLSQVCCVQRGGLVRRGGVVHKEGVGVVYLPI